MAKVHFAPHSAIKYLGSKTKVFHTSLARPKPKLVKGDIVIVDKKTAFNLVRKGFEEFAYVESIEFFKKDSIDAKSASKVIEELEAYKAENISLFSRLVTSQEENQKLLAQIDAKPKGIINATKDAFGIGSK